MKGPVPASQGLHCGPSPQSGPSRRDCPAPSGLSCPYRCWGPRCLLHRSFLVTPPFQAILLRTFPPTHASPLPSSCPSWASTATCSFRSPRLHQPPDLPLQPTLSLLSSRGPSWPSPGTSSSTVPKVCLPHHTFSSSFVPQLREGPHHPFGPQILK